MSKVAEDIYSGAAAFGRVMAIFGAVIVGILGLLFTIGGFAVIFRKRWTPVSASITQINGSPTGVCAQGTQGGNFSCNLTLSYEWPKGTPLVANVKYQGSAQRFVGEQLTIYVKSSDGTNISLDQDVPRWVGGVFIGVSVLVVGLVWGWVWVTSKYKFAAAAQGVSGAYDIVRSSI